MISCVAPQSLSGADEGRTVLTNRPDTLLYGEAHLIYMFILCAREIADQEWIL
jgi:hypothetical protein